MKLISAVIVAVSLMASAANASALNESIIQTVDVVHEGWGGIIGDDR